MSGAAMQVDVIMGGPGHEAAISRRSGAAIAAALGRCGYDVAVVDLLATLDIARLRPGALVFNTVHGTYGEDGTLQRELEAAGRVFVGSDALASALCMDKEATKKRLEKAGVRVPWGVKIDLKTPFSPRDLRIPNHAGLVLKPVADGSSVGLSMVANPSFLLPAIEDLLRDTWSTHRGPLPYLVEERLPGPEYTVAVIDDETGPRALPPLAIRAASGIFDFEAKYQRADTMEEPVADPALAARLGALAVTVHRVCGCRDLSRTDLMVTSDGDLAVLEINTLPGCTDQSLTPKAAAAAGIPFDLLMDRLVRRAAARLGQRSAQP